MSNGSRPRRPAGRRPVEIQSGVDRHDQVRRQHEKWRPSNQWPARAPTCDRVRAHRLHFMQHGHPCAQNTRKYALSGGRSCTWVGIACGGDPPGGGFGSTDPHAFVAGSGRAGATRSRPAITGQGRCHPARRWSASSLHAGRLIPVRLNSTSAQSAGVVCAPAEKPRVRSPSVAAGRRLSLLASEGDFGYHVSVESFLARPGGGWSFRHGQADTDAA